MKVWCKAYSVLEYVLSKIDVGVSMKRIYLFMLLFLFCFYQNSDAGYSSGSSSRSYSSGSSSRSYSSGSSKSSSGSSSSSSGRSFSSGSSSNKSSGTTSKSFDSKASGAAKTYESKTSFFRSKPNYTRPPVSEPKVQEAKRQTFYQTYYSNPTYTREIHHYHYRDSYSPFFMLWLLDRSSDERAMWAYHHRNDMDQDRYKEMLKKDTELEKKIQELEAKGIQKDPNYKPQDIDNDLMYKSDADIKKEESNIGAYFGYFFITIFSIAGVWYFYPRRKSLKNEKRGTRK